jgi:REP element-mobilizing transposase RayT
MLDDHGFEKFEENQFPLAYLITFRTYGTWLHGDNRGAVARQGGNQFGAPLMPPNPGLHSSMRNAAHAPAVLLTPPMRAAVDAAIRDICAHRGYFLQSVNVRTNHVHAVVSAERSPERIADEMKANATKLLRAEGFIERDGKVWSRGRSRRYLWKPNHVISAIDYVLHSQDDDPFWLPDE